MHKAFALERGLTNAEIHAMDWDGSNFMQLTDTKNNISGAQGICQGTKITDDGSRSAHFEHSIAVTFDGPRVLTVP